jgi:hypothetical protein
MAKEQLIEDVAEHIEGVANQLDEAAEVARQLDTRALGFFFVGAGLGVAAGFAVGYFAMSKRVQLKYQKLAEAEIAEMREDYQKRRTALEGEVQRRRPLEELIVERGYSEVEQAEIDEVETATGEVIPGPAQTNIFEGAQPELEWDYASEIKSRNPEVPYIIHIDEFTENEPEHDQLTYTYYEVDDALVDSRDNTVDDMDEFIGLGNLGRWGHGSGDPNIVYIRNEHLSMDMEVVRDPGSYAQETGRSLRHSSSQDRRKRPQRGFDDD